MNDQQTMDVAVVGVGRMGSHHARTYNKIPQANLVAVVDQDTERAETVADEYGCQSYAATDELLANHPNLKAVTIAVPTIYHCAAAEPFLKRHIACLIEKPLAPTVADAKILNDLAAETKTVLQVGHTERFNPAVRAVAALDLPVRFMEVHRVSPMTFRSLDIGVVMDMMIHDLDIVLAFAASPLVDVQATGVAVLGEHEDIANARLKFESGCVATLTASRLAMKTERKMRLIGEDAYVSLDYHSREGVLISKAKNIDALEEIRRGLAEGRDLSEMDYSKIVQIDDLAMDGEEDPLTGQATSFLRSIRGDEAPVVDGSAGYAAVDAAERVVSAIREHRWEGRPAHAIL